MALGNILEDILAERASNPRLCALGRWLSSLPAEDEAKVQTALASETDGRFTVRHTELAAYLARNGFTTTEYMVGEHRRNTCACSKASQ